MGQRLQWRIGILQGVLFGVLFGLQGRYLQDQSPTAAVVTGVVGGVFFGAAMTVLMHRGWKRLHRGLAESLTPQEIAEVDRAAIRGVLLQDDRLRTVAAELARRRLAQGERQRVPTLIILGVVTIFATVMAVASHPWWWVAAGLLVLVAVVSEVELRRLQTRLQPLISSTPT